MARMVAVAVVARVLKLHCEATPDLAEWECYLGCSGSVVCCCS